MGRDGDDAVGDEEDDDDNDEDADDDMNTCDHMKTKDGKICGKRISGAPSGSRTTRKSTPQRHQELLQPRPRNQKQLQPRPRRIPSRSNAVYLNSLREKCHTIT